MPVPKIEHWRQYFDLRDSGVGVGEAAKRSGIDRSSAYRFERGDTASQGARAAQELGRNVVAGKIVAAALQADAATALDDFATFRMRYMGRASTPWQAEAANEVRAALDTDDRQYVVVNMPPGSGKSTLFTHDIACWLIARRRNVRILIGSRTERQARMYVGRIKRTLERDVPLVADPELLAKGVVFNAAATLSGDYGAFKPEGRSDLWRNDALVVQQPGGMAADDKEPTVSAYGQDSGFLGGRYDVVLWDDLVDSRNTRTDESMTRTREWYSTEAETRLEPGGVFILQGQRIAADDLYRYALDLKNADDTPKYRHIVYPAHDTDRCENIHGPDSPPWPAGCLLDPRRLPFNELDRIRINEPRTYNLMYQQDDTFVVGGILDPVWLTGGVDADGAYTPGCYDDRSFGTVPELDDAWSILSIDPSPAEYWGICWWLFDTDTQALHMVDLHRGRLTPEQFLHYDIDTKEFSGLLHDWWKRSVEAKEPLDTVVVEINAAQRWLISQPHVQRWQQVTGVSIVPHQTGRNKADPEYGVESLGTWFKHGRFRLPHRTPADKIKTALFTDEALKYPTARTSDVLMSAWFATLLTQTGYRPNSQGRYGRIGSRDTASRGLSAALR